MPWELPSVLTRLRRPVGRQPTPEVPPQDTTPQLQHEPSAQQLPIDRKILQDPSSYLDAEAEDALPLGLTPSTRLPSAGSSGNTRSRPRPRDYPSGPGELPPGSSVNISPRTQSLALSRISKIAAGGEWSTFGRKREHRIPDVADLPGRTSPPDNPKRTSHSQSPTRDSTDSTPSTFTLSRIINPSRPSEKYSSPSPRSRQSPDSGASSPANTMSSKRHPRTPQRSPSSTAPVTSPITLSTPVHRASDSPHTFGHPTPPDNTSVAYPSPVPPLPPLDHPELAAALSSRRKSDQPTSYAFRDRSNTLPTNRHHDLFPSLSLKLGRPARRQSSLAQAMTEQHGPPDAPRRRARTDSGGGRVRRTSADWSSHQAMGVSSHVNQAWPAEVSREILRLSLATPAPDAAPGSPGRREAPARGPSADPARSPDRGTMSPSFLPFPHPSRQSSPPPSRASATPPGQSNPTFFTPPSHPTSESHPDGREILLPRPHSLHFDPRPSAHPGRFTMVEVKRGLSAMEARNGRHNEASGATYASLGLSDPAPTSSEAPQHPSSAPAPSTSLFSGRVSPTNTPMSSSMRREPSTPTPAPRQLSDKSRGKRKAEDNLDLTPPEQKKEGQQRATFLLPSQSRSKCHS